MTSLIGIRFWKISPGKQAYLWEEFKTKNYIAIGWNDVGDLRKFANRDKMIKEFYDVYPDSLPDQVLEFFYDMKKGDKVLIYGNKSIYALGEILSDYYYKEEESEVYYLYNHRRDVKWLKIPDPPLSIEFLHEELQRKLMRPRTIIELAENEWKSVEEVIKEQPPPEELEQPAPTEPAFSISLERTLRDYLAENPNILEYGLQLIRKEYPTDAGNIDILFKDKNGNYVIVEAKKGRESDKVVGQILRYVGWVKKNLAPKVRGIIVTHSSDSNLEWAIEAIRDSVKLKFYKVKFELSDAS
ncbi:MAG: endonuclease NucS [Candidatus Bathyarchaeia archaeon]